jgi:hypothetical protein
MYADPFGTTLTDERQCRTWEISGLQGQSQYWTFVFVEEDSLTVKATSLFEVEYTSNSPCTSIGSLLGDVNWRRHKSPTYPVC